MRVYVVYCHPLAESFTAAIRDRAVAALASAGHEVRLTDLYGENFQPELTAWERVHHLDSPDQKPAILPYAEHLRWCDALVFVYPTWWSGQPAMLKGWIDRVWVSGVAYELPDGGNRIRPRLRNIRRIAAITTHGSSKSVNALQGEGGKRIISRSLRVLCHPLARTRWVALYSIDRCTDADRTKFLDRVERSMHRL